MSNADNSPSDAPIASVPKKGSLPIWLVVVVILACLGGVFAVYQNLTASKDIIMHKGAGPGSPVRPSGGPGGGGGHKAGGGGAPGAPGAPKGDKPAAGGDNKPKTDKPADAPKNSSSGPTTP